MSEFVSMESEQAVLGSMLIDSGCIRHAIVPAASAFTSESWLMTWSIE